MAKVSKSNVLKFKAKTKSAKTGESAPSVAKKKEPKVTAVEAKPVAEVKQAAISTETPAAKTGDKKVSQKLLETIERRKKGQEAGKGSQFYSKPPGRRGRRPKAASEYIPGNQNEEEAYTLENDYTGIEYDTGIRVREGGEDRGFNVERFDDYDEELNFDW